MCRDLNNFEFRCNCKGTHYKGPLCDIGIIYIPQIPILTVGQTVTLNIEAHPLDEVYLTILSESNGISLYPTSITFNNEVMLATVSVTANMHGIHLIHFSVSWKGSQQFENPQSMMVIVQQNHSQFIDMEEQHSTKINHTSSILTPGCCKKHDSNFTCTQSDSSPTFISTCSWEKSSETFGIVFYGDQDTLLPISVVGLKTNSENPLITLPSSLISCSTCNSDCDFYNLTEEEVIIDLIKSHALAKSFLSYMQELIPNYVDFMINTSELHDTNFFPYDVIVDIVAREDISLVNGCESLDLYHKGLYVVLRYNDSLHFSYNGNEYSYLPRTGDNPICFAVRLCNISFSPVYITIPQGLQEDLEQVNVLKVCLYFLS